MPKIPRQAARTVMPNVGGGGGGGGGAATNARSLASSAGAGLQSLGSSVASSAAGLSQAFAHAGAVRDQIRERAEAERRRIAEKLDSQNQRTGAYQIGLDYQRKINEDKQELADQLAQQQDTNPNTWKVKIRNRDGTLQEEGMLPDAAMNASMKNRMDEALELADGYGSEARLHVAEMVSRDARVAQAEFSDQHLKLKHDKTLADWQSVANRLEDQAADPSNRFREKAKLDLEDHIANGQGSGLFSPTQGLKVKETMRDSVADKWATAEAMQRPVEFLEKISGPSAHAELTADGSTIVFDKAQRLPENLKAEKLPHYQAIALGALAQEQAKTDRVEKAYEKRIKVEQEKNFGDGMSTLLSGGSVAGNLSQQIKDGLIDPDKANILRTVEHTLKVQNANDPVLIRQSALTRIDYSRSITNAMFGEGHLDTITDNMMRDAAEGTMRPTDVEPLMTEIRTARTHLVSEENQKQNEAVRNNKAYIRDMLTTTGPLDKYDQVSEDSKAEATKLFLSRMQANPTQDSGKVRDEVLKVWLPVVEERKKLLGETPDQVKLDEAKLQSLVQQKALSPAGAKAIREKRENEKGRKIVSDFLSTYKPPDPSFWEKARSISERAKAFGSSLFEDESTEAAP